VERPGRPLLLLVTALVLAGAQRAAADRVELSLEHNPIRLTLEAIESATDSIELVTYKFDEGSLEKAAKRALARGLRVRIVADADEAKRQRSRIGDVHEAGAEVRVWKKGKLHAKWAAFDGRTVLTGSFNWTESAQHKNVELIHRTDDPATAKRFGELFELLWDRSEPFED
jgi:phosphatidylserine/phosphatidylglycerophosphate/cardiolipin synthase-like enzyme